MKVSNIGVVLGVAAAMMSTHSYADEHRNAARGSHRIDSGMKAITTGARGGEAGFGWRYFTDARDGRAVVISPSGDYFYSDGQGLKLVFKATTAA